MAVGTVEFYSMPGSISSGEYPIFTENQDVSGYLVESVEKCKYTKDLLQAVGPIAVFDDYDTVNMAKINDEWYWVVDWTTQSLQKESVIFGLSYNAPTSNLRLGQNLTGVFSRTPTRTRPYMTAVISNDAMKGNRYVELANMGDYRLYAGATPSKLLWVEVVYITTTTADIKKYGFFATVDYESLEPSGVVLSDNQLTNRRYPTINEVIQNPEGILDIQGDQIIQIAVSERCPFEYEILSFQYYTDTYYSIRLDGLAPVTVKNTTDYLIQVYIPGQSWPSSFGPSTTVSMTLTEIERTCGSLRIVTESGSVVATIPSQYGDTITLEVKCFDDYTGIYTDINFEGRLLATINEGHLPWAGSTWSQYQARQMEYDRQMTSMANQQARADLNINLEQSEMNQVFTQLNAIGGVGLFNPGSWVSAVLTYTEANARGRFEREAMSKRTSLEIQGNDLKQKLTEKMMMAEPGTAYSMGYGTIYCKNTALHPARLQLEMPANLTTTYYNEFMAEYGYPSEGKQTLVLSAGFIQGQIINNGTITGAKFDELSRTLQNGIKMRSLT